MRTIHVDTKELEDGLRAFTGQPQEVAAGLQLLNHLLLSSGVTYDGASGGGRAARITALLHQLQDRLDAETATWLGNAITPVHIPPDRERQALIESADSAVTFFEMVEPRWTEARAVLDRHQGRGLTDPQRYLFGPLASESAWLDHDLLNQSDITGRRFYWALRSDDRLVARLRRLKSGEKLGPKRLALLFNRFRTHLAESIGRLSPATGDSSIYMPNPIRGNLANRIGIALRAQRDPVSERLVPALEQLWYDRVTSEYYGTSRILVPFVLHPYLVNDDIGTPIELLRSVVDARRTGALAEIHKAVTAFAVTDRQGQDEILESLAPLLAARLEDEDLRKVEGRQLLIGVLWDAVGMDLKGAVERLATHLRRWSDDDLQRALVLSRLPLQMVSNEDSLLGSKRIFGHLPRAA